MRSFFKTNRIPLLVTIAMFIAAYAVAAVRYEGFFSWYVFSSALLGDNASVGLASIGETFVIISGGIDLSVGAMISFISILLAKLVVTWHIPTPLAIVIVLAVGAGLGACMGGTIQFFRLPPFLVTLGGMFLVRGMALAITVEKRLSMTQDPFIAQMSTFKLAGLPVAAIVFLAMLLVAMYLAHYRRFGRVMYAIGGNEQSAVLMGLPVSRTKIRIYAFSGLCAAMGGIVHTFVTGAGDSTVAYMKELDAIAAVVIGGTLLSGGVGYVFGTLMGVLILGVIQTGITFEGTLSSWWSKIAIGGLLLAFILLQQVLQGRALARAVGGRTNSSRKGGK